MKSNKVRTQIQRESQGTKVLSISAARLANISLIIPQKREQQKISAFFSSVDDKLQSLKKKKNLFEQYRKGVMQKIFSLNLRFKDDNNNDFPIWQPKTLGEITYKAEKRNSLKEVLPIFSINNSYGFIPQSEQFEGIDSNERGYDISLYKIVDRNTFIYNPARINVGSIGYSDVSGRVLVSSLYVCFKTTEMINDLFFNYFLKTRHFKNSVLKYGEGGVRIYLFYENFSEINILVPSIPEQNKISTFLSSIDDKINNIQTQIEKTTLYKKSLLQKMFC